MHSKATAALLRLKEIDRKYNVKRNDSKRAPSNVSTESTPSSSPRNLEINSREIIDQKSKLDTLKNGNDVDLSPEEKPKLKFLKASGKSKIDVKIPSIYVKSEMGKNDSRESSVSSLKSEISVENSSESQFKSALATNDPSLSNDSRVKVDSKISNDGRKSSRKSIESPLLTVSSFKRSQVRESRFVKEEESSGKKAFSLKSPRNAVLVNENDLNDLKDSVEKTDEIASEFSQSIEENIPSIESNEHTGRENEGQGYGSDTFEDISSSTILSKSKKDGATIVSALKQAEIQEIASFGVKRVEITLHEQVEAYREENEVESNKEIIELIPPKILQSTSECEIGLDKELSNYVKAIEEIDEPMPINLLKSKQLIASRKSGRKLKKPVQLKENSEENFKLSRNSDYEKSDSQSINEIIEEEPDDISSDATFLSGEKKESSDKSIEDENKKLSKNEVDLSKNLNDIDTVKSETKFELERNENEQEESVKKNILESLEEMPEKSVDATSMLRKLNRDAIDAIARRPRIYESKEKSVKIQRCNNCGESVEFSIADCQAVMKTNFMESGVSLRENIEISKRDNRDKKSKTRAKSAKHRKTTSHSKVEEKLHSRFDCKQAYRVHKLYIQKLQQERQGIRNCLLEFERRRLEFAQESSKALAIKPLQFPKIADFVKPDDLELKSTGEVAKLQQRVSMIRQWLKDQYTLYRNYSNFAETLNAKYVPTSLEDAKKTIRQL